MVFPFGGSPPQKIAEVWDCFTVNASGTYSAVSGSVAASGAQGILANVIIGGGTMGRGITLAFADRGLPVRLIEVSEPALEKAMGYIRAGMKSLGVP